MTRRRALELLGTSAAAAAVSGPVFGQPAATPPAFPKGSIIRTILRDYAPEELAGGATLFHEHMQLAPDFGAKFGAATAAARAANGLPPAPARGGGAGGGSAARPGHHARRRSDVRRGLRRQTRRQPRLHRRRRPSGHGARRQLPAPGVDEVRRADRRGRRVLLAALVSERDFDDERGTNLPRAHQAGRRRHRRRVRRNRLVGRDHG